MTTKLYSVLIRTEEDVVKVRRKARDIAALLEFDGGDQTRIATAVSEIARNAFSYGVGGVADYLLDGEGSFAIQIADTGAGIADLKKILSGRYKSNSGMGLGILGARRLMDGFSIESQPGKGTVVRLSKTLPDKIRPLTKQRLAGIAAELAKFPERNLMDELRLENHERLRAMDELRGRQEDLTRLNAELEDTNRGVVALYAELDEKAERLRRAGEMKSQFLSHMSHEFRTPLTSIMALSHLLADESDGKLSSEQHKQVSFIRKSAETLLELVNDLLDLARVEAGKSVVRPTHFQVTNLFGALRGVLRPLQVNDAVELIFDDASTLPPLHTDEAKVAQILRNFVSNALKFTERGEVRVAATLSEDAQSAVFSVSDTGVGIAPANLDLIFQEFGQVNMPMQTKFKGSGLGLPLSRGLAELLGGSVRVESKPGGGSTFYATIPLVYSGSEFEKSAVADADVLLIDDEEVARYLLRQALGPSITAMEASDGLTGIELAKKHHPRAILLDIRMPTLSGFEVLKELKANPATRDIPVVIMTAQALTSEELDSLSAQAVAVLSKEMLSQPDGGQRIRMAITDRESN